MTTLLVLKILVAILTIIVVFFIVKCLKIKAKFERKFDQKLKPYLSQISDLQAEIKRLNFLIEQYKNQNKKQLNQPLDLEKANIDINELIAEKQRLEQEKQSLKEKTKKLWEQSLAIHREKDRIDAMRREIEKRHKEVTDSINYASRIQTALLPSEQDFAKIFKEFFILWKPREIVSGDFYWLNRFKNRIFLVVADCTGHGVPGAFMSLLGISFLNEIINANPYLQANEILEILRQKVIAALGETEDTKRPKDGMDMALVIINTDTNILQYSGANNPAYIVRNQEIIELKPVRAPIGYYLIQKQFKNIDLQLQSGDVLYMFSDGYFDQFGGLDGKTKFTRKRFKQLLIEMNARKIPLPDQKLVLWEVLEEWKKDTRQIDDILVIGVKWV